MVHTDSYHTYECSYCRKLVIHLGLLNDHLNMKQDSLNGETDDTDEAKDIK